MSDKFITDTAGVFEVGQTVLAKVTNLDEEKRRFLISLKVSEVNWAESNAQARLIQGQGERIAVYNAMALRGKRYPNERQDKLRMHFCTSQCKTVWLMMNRCVCVCVCVVRVSLKYDKGIWVIAQAITK